MNNWWGNLKSIIEKKARKKNLLQNSTIVKWVKFIMLKVKLINLFQICL